MSKIRPVWNYKNLPVAAEPLGRKNDVELIVPPNIIELHIPECTINASTIERGMNVWCCLDHCQEAIDARKKTKKLSKSDQDNQ